MDETPELRRRIADLKAARITRPATWPLSWWFAAAIVETAATVFAIFGLFAVWRDWPWPWMAATFMVGAGYQIVMLWRRDRKRYGGPAQSGR